jgi:hypothetical protein
LVTGKISGERGLLEKFGSGKVSGDNLGPRDRSYSPTYNQETMPPPKSLGYLPSSNYNGSGNE